MPTNVDNWLTRRGAGALLNLQRTPFVVGADAITANPKKAQANKNFSHTNQYLTNWPTKSVVKISGSPGIEMNALELETRRTIKYGDWTAVYYEETDQLYIDIASAASNSATDFSIGAPVIWPSYFNGSDYSLYNTAEWIANVKYQLDKDSDGIPEDYYDIYKVNVTSTPSNTGNSSLMTYPCSTSVELEQTTEATGAYQAKPTQQFPDVTIYANFGTTKKYALDVLSAAPTDGPSTGASFCARHPDDPAHGLASYVIEQNHIPYLNGGQSVSFIGSYRHTSTDSPASVCLQADCECKFFYTPGACDDCWYAGKTVTIEITYKKIAFTDSGPTYTGTTLDKTVTMGSATSHSTVTKTLTLPSGRTRVQVGDTFSVPTSDGYAVVIDDIKLVSVT